MSELTQTKPDDWAICAKLSMGRSKLLTVGSPLAGAAGVGAVVGAVVGAGAMVVAVATGVAVTGAETGVGAGTLAAVSAATAAEGAAAAAIGAASGITGMTLSDAVADGAGADAAEACARSKYERPAGRSSACAGTGRSVDVAISVNGITQVLIIIIKYHTLVIDKDVFKRN
jgi:hypothetical protein